MLAGKLKFGIFQEPIHQDDELPHGGDQGVRAGRSQFPQLRHLGQHQGCRGEGDAGDGIQPLHLLLQIGICGDQGHQGIITLADLFFQPGQQLAGLLLRKTILVMLGAVAFDVFEIQQLLVAGGVGAGWKVVP